MWKNFLSSIALLAIALAAALYSSSVSNEGRSMAAGISAVLALALAVLVGIRFVPHLARGVSWEWFPRVSHYKITRDGWIFLVTTVIVIFAAVNTSNNLLYMVLSLLLAVLLISGFLLELNFKFLKAEILLPAHITAGETFPFSIRIHNPRRVFPMISARIEPAADSPMKFEPVYFSAVEPLSDSKLATESVLPRRGLYRIRHVQGTSKFPFGLLSKSRNCDVDGEILCYPAIVSRDMLNISALDVHGSVQRYERGSGYDLHTIRDYLSSDSARHVHWKASAKTASLKTREFAADESHHIVLALDRFGWPEDVERFEQLVTHAASLAFHCIQDGTDIVLVSDEWQSRTGSPEVVLNSILEYLAIVEMSTDAYLPDVDPERGSLLLSLRQGNG